MTQWTARHYLKSTMPPRINLPPLTRALFLLLLALSALNAALRFHAWSASLSSATPTQLATTPSNYLSDPQWAQPFLVLVPVRSIKYPWTSLTAVLVENNVLSLAISGCVVWFLGRYLERAWGTVEFGKFVLFGSMIPNILTFFLYAIWHAVNGAPEQ